MKTLRTALGIIYMVLILGLVGGNEQDLISIKDMLAVMVILTAVWLLIDKKIDGRW